MGGLVTLESRPNQLSATCSSLDAVGVKEVFSKRVAVMHSVPGVIRKAYRKAMRVALQEVARDINELSDVRITFLFFPDFFLWRPVRADWCQRMVQSCGSVHSRQTSSFTAKIHPRRRRRHQQRVTIVRGNSCFVSCHVSMLASCQPQGKFRKEFFVDLGAHATLQALTDPERRPPVPRLELGQEVARSDPAHPFILASNGEQPLDHRDDRKQCVPILGNSRISVCSSKWQPHLGNSQLPRGHEKRVGGK